MRFVSLSLNNFGPYGAKQQFQLDGQNGKKNIVLIGGKNGCGKTTFLDSLYIVLYGKQPREGGMSRYEIIRSWKTSGDKVKEEFIVNSDAEDRGLVQENWAIIINEILPIRLSKLFFFDGEKIESLADLSSSKDILNDAINTLLGLDTTDRLINDLNYFKKEKQKTTMNTETLQNFELKEKQLEGLKIHLQEQGEKDKELNYELQVIQDEISNLNQQLELKGEDLYLKKNEIQNEIFKLENRKQDLQFTLRRLAGRHLPFFIIKEKMSYLKAQAEQEKQVMRVKDFSQVIDEHDQEILIHLKKNNPDAVDALSTFIENLKSKNVKMLNQSVLFDENENQAIAKFYTDRSIISEKSTPGLPH